MKSRFSLSAASPPRWSRRVRIVALVLLAAGTALSLPLFARADTKEGAKAAPRAALTVRLTQAETLPLPRTLAANGNVAAWQEAVIGAEANGLRVAELLASVGDRVHKGQVLASFARDTVEADLRLAEASLREARASAVEAKADGERARRLQGTGALSEQQLQQLLTREQTALARVDSAEAQLDAQKLRLAQATLRAPDDGIISSRSATTGSVPAQGSEMFRLIRQGRLEWRGEFSADELEQIRIGQSVRIQSAAGSVWQGKVRQISPTLDTASRRGIAYVDILPPAQRDAAPIRAGSYVRGEIVLGEQNALVLPQAAIVARDGYHLVCVVSDDMRVSLRRVKLGRLVGDRQQLLDGLKPGERVVASGGAFLSEGDTVQLAAPATPAR